MNRRPLRVIVVGGGIGGLASSVLLARGGAQVTLIDPGDGPTGSRAPAATERLGGPTRHRT